MAELEAPVLATAMQLPFAATSGAIAWPIIATAARRLSRSFGRPDRS